MWKNLLWTLALAAASPGAWAVMKCVGDGKTWYQDAPCPAGTTAMPLQLEAGPAAATPAGREPVDKGADRPASAASTPAPEPAPAAGTAPSALDVDARACLAWYASHVPLAAGASYLNPSRQGRVVSIVISMPISVRNPTGAKVQGATQTPASCEIVNGRLDDGWTRTHARRGNWIP